MLCERETTRERHHAVHIEVECTGNVQIGGGSLEEDDDILRAAVRKRNSNCFIDRGAGLVQAHTERTAKCQTLYAQQGRPAGGIDRERRRCGRRTTALFDHDQSKLDILDQDAHRLGVDYHVIGIGRFVIGYSRGALADKYLDPSRTDLDLRRRNAASGSAHALCEGKSALHGDKLGSGLGIDNLENNRTGQAKRYILRELNLNRDNLVRIVRIGHVEQFVDHKTVIVFHRVAGVVLSEFKGPAQFKAVDAKQTRPAGGNEGHFRARRGGIGRKRSSGIRHIQFFVHDETELDILD